MTIPLVVPHPTSHPSGSQPKFLTQNPNLRRAYEISGLDGSGPPASDGKPYPTWERWHSTGLEMAPAARKTV